ncbi:protein of unknown function [Bacillus sp. OV322]|uniref:DUF1540 domain-containing protein n=1 Tax=Bacillus sp. OV322 TaxID=1882764 RepID=UPI0008EA2C4B|nr:DUF1540 domain-containing protein [Bacillus sp. OV322]SFC59321.1 protein of unknown function [Bacillus sp. OV322]
MAEDVKCTVNNCRYWKHGNRCSAESIMVVNYSEERAHTSNDAGCRTFEPA